MAYDAFDPAQPNTNVGNPRQTAIDKTRKNLLALRHMLAAASAGPLYGWNRTQSGGTDEQPAEVIYAKGVYRIKVVTTWGTSGGASGSPTKEAYYFSSNSGGAYDPLLDEDGLYVATFTYNTGGTCTADTWGSTP